jgi:hypothetical protein
MILYRPTSKKPGDTTGDVKDKKDTRAQKSEKDKSEAPSEQSKDGGDQHEKKQGIGIVGLCREGAGKEGCAWFL